MYPPSHACILLLIGDADESPAIAAEVVGTCLVIVNWSTLWSQVLLMCC